MRDLSIYIHIPFCVRKCLYCDFLSFAASVGEIESYVNLLAQEMEEQAVLYRDHRVVSVFLGGGTPSLLSAEETGRILQAVRENYRMTDGAEITMECNPGTVTAEKLENYITYGINRLSIGLQSTQDEELVRIGRIHDYEMFRNTYHAARKAGFANINIDLMAALPGQSIASYRESLERVADLTPEHISAYSLILEEGTPLYDRKEQYRFPTEEEDREMYRMTKEYLGERGYQRYEISNYAREGFACRHNQVYWRRGDYVGFGLGAASMVRDVRWSVPQKMESYRDYVEGMCGRMKSMARQRDGLQQMLTEAQGQERQLLYQYFPDAHVLTVKEQMEEFMFLGLRMMCGVDCRVFRDKFGREMEAVYGPVIEKMKSQGLLQKEDEYIKLTDRGIDVSNYVMAEFLFD